MTAPEEQSDQRRPVHPPVMRLLAAGYARGGVVFVWRALVVGQLGVAFVFAIVGPMVARLFAPMPVRDLLGLAAFALVIYLTDGVAAIAAIRPHLRTLEHWARTRDAATAAAAWRAAADIPFAPLRRRGTDAVVLALIVGWGLMLVSLQGLPATSFLLFFPGSVLLWLYWLALRFFGSEQLVRPVLADISIEFPDTGDNAGVRVTLARRLFIAIPAITVIAGMVVAGVVGDHTIRAIAVGAGVSIAVTFGIAGLLVLLLARSVTEPVADLREGADRVGGGDLTVRVPVTSVDEIGALARSFNTMVDGLRERERIRAAFGTYVDHTVAEHILAAGPSILAGEDVEITALFLDVRGFTSYSERLPAGEVVAMLNRLFEIVVPIVHGHGGHVDKFVGDGLLAVFGVPQRHTDHADRALAAALSIAAAVERRSEGEPRIGIGLNSGTVVAGNLGGAGRFEFTVIGDTVNVAARVESATRHTGDTILLSEHTRRLLRGSTIALTARPLLPLKGKTEPVALYTPAAAGRAGQSES